METDRSRAERFDELWERTQVGRPGPIDDPELAELLGLAERLQRELPEDLPDPVFRARLNEQLIEGPEPSALPPTAPAPVDFGTERRRRRRWGFDWRFAAPAAAMVAVLLMVMIAGLDTFEGSERLQPTAQSGVVMQSNPPTAGQAQDHARTESAPTSAPAVSEPATKEKGPSFAERTAFPPLDAEHVVLGPLGLGGAGGRAASGFQPGEAGAEATPAGPTITRSAPLSPLPDSAQADVLIAPREPIEFLETFKARLGVEGAVKRLTEESSPNQLYGVVDQAGVPFIYWDHERAYFNYDRGLSLETPPAPSRLEGGPATLAERWLEEVGFDLSTIEYETSSTSDPVLTIVTFTPTTVPPIDVAPGLGVTVGVNPDGAVQFAYGFWFSRGEGGDVPLRTIDDAWAALQAGEGFSPFVPIDDPDLKLDVIGSSLGHLLTRDDEGSYLLQPVVVFSAKTPELEDDDASLSIYVSAVQPR